MQPPNEVITEKILKESLSQNGKVVNKCSTKALKLPAVYINEEYDDDDEDDYDD